MRLSYDSIQVVFLDLLALQESVRIVNQFLLSPYLSYVCVNEPFTFLDSVFFFFSQENIYWQDQGIEGLNLAIFVCELHKGVMHMELIIKAWNMP